jgi:large repetitive protein
MVKAIGFAVRDSAGGLVRGTVGGEGGNFIPVGSGEKISLNLSSANIVSYERQGSDLIIKLADGSSIVLSGFYSPGAENHLFLSSDGVISEVILNGQGNGLLYAEYGPAEGWNKFSVLDDLRFADSAMGAGEIVDEPAGMGFLAPGLLGAGAGAAGLGAAALVGGAALIGGGGGDGNDTTGGGDGNDTTGGGDGNDTTGGGDGNDTTGGGDGNDTTGGGGGNDTTGGGGGNDTTGGGGGNDTTGGGGGGQPGDNRARPTVDEPDRTDTLTTNTTNPQLVVTGTGEPGDTVLVNIGGRTETTTIRNDGTWGVVFDRTEFPADGDHRANVVVTQPGGQQTTLVGPSFIIDMTPPQVQVTEGVYSINEYIENAAAFTNGVQIGGTGEVGATVAVTISGHTEIVTIGSSGTWQVTFNVPQVNGGDFHSYPVRVVATDPLGNTTTLNETLVIDTVNGVSFNDVQAGDNVISAAERGATAGVVLSGTGEAGASIVVTFEGKERITTVNGSGQWSVTFNSGDFPAGTYDSTVTVTSRDKAGNIATDSHVVKIDTEVTPFVMKPNLAGQIDDIYLNGAEASAGLTVELTLEAGSHSVLVRLGNGNAYPATLQANGKWSVVIPTSEIPAGEATVALTATARDQYNNFGTVTQNIEVDRVVRNLGITGQIGGDGYVNAAEASAGVTIRGTVEANANVVVTLSNGSTLQTTSNASGQWSVTFGSDQMPRGDISMRATVNVTDRAGNTAQIHQDFRLDTEAPDAAQVLSVDQVAGGFRKLGTTLTDDIYSFTRIDESGAAVPINADRADNATWNETDFRLSSVVPDGSYLVINNSDLAGNTASTLLISDVTSNPTVDLGRTGLSNFDFASIDLTFATRASLTITEQQLVNMTGEENQLVIKGGRDDTVTALGAQDSGQTTMIGGQAYKIFVLGDDGASLIIDADINTVI